MNDMTDGREISGGTSDFAGTREYQPGDSPKHIHWGQYAKTGDLYTKSFVDYESQDIWLDWQSLNISGTEPRLSHKQYGLRIPGKEIQPNKGEAHKIRCLTALALFGLPQEEASYAG